MVVTTARGHRSGPLLSRGKMDGLFMKEFVFVYMCVHSTYVPDVVDYGFEWCMEKLHIMCMLLAFIV